jgi:hypothetical protein
VEKKMFQKQEKHPVLKFMTEEDKESARRTSVRMSMQEVHAARENYQRLYPNTPLPSNKGDEMLILAHLSNEYGYPSPK